MPPSTAISRAILGRRLARQGHEEVKPKGALEQMAEHMARGPNGELYHFPQDMFTRDRGAWSGLRDVIDRGIIQPSEKLPPTLKYSEAARLARTVGEAGLPKRTIMPPAYEALALRMNNKGGGTAESLAAMSGPGVTHDKLSAYLFDLSGSEVQGSGTELLKNVLSGPLFPDAKQFMFTPLPGVRDYYKSKFGASILSPDEAMSDKHVSDILKAVGQSGNAEDLGVGIIQRKRGGLARLAGGGKIFKGLKAATRSAPDPLSALVATRMAGQLQGVSQLPGLSGLSKLNLPAAYAGDQRSLTAVQRVINEAETGLASPGRRKMLKQGAATAARGLVPDAVMSGLGDAVGAGVLRKMVGDTVTAAPTAIPVESLQAAYGVAMEKSLAKLAAVKSQFGEYSPEYSDAIEVIREKLTPANIARKTGLPEEALTKHVGDTADPRDVFEDWAYGAQNMEAFSDDPSHKWLRDWVDDPGNTNGPDMERAWAEASDTDDAATHIIGTWAWAWPKEALTPMQNLLGKKANELDNVYSEHFTSPQNRIQNMVDMILDNQYDNLYEGVVEGLP